MRVFLKTAIVWILTAEARLLLYRHEPRIIAVTGSVGKTTTKDAIYAALAPSLHARKSEKSLNSEIGVPLAILGLENAWGNPLRWLVNIFEGVLAIFRPYPEWLVLEVGADHPGDIRRIARWLRPHIAVITGVPEIPVHVEYFPSPEAVLAEKLALAEFVRAGGTVVLNGDDPRLSVRASQFPSVRTYGTQHGADVRATHEAPIVVRGVPMGMRFRAHAGKEALSLSVLGALGRPRIYAALAALAVADVALVPLAAAAEGLGTWPPPPGRMRIIPGASGSTLIDDTYNSSPVAAHAALDALAHLPRSGRKVAILGDMLELGRFSVSAHKELGAFVPASADILVTMGLRARGIAEGAREAGMPAEVIHSFEQGAGEEVARLVRKGLAKGDVVLLKGSQGMRMERIVKALMAEPSHAADLIVRQEPEWLVR